MRLDLLIEPTLSFAKDNFISWFLSYKLLFNRIAFKGFADIGDKSLSISCSFSTSPPQKKNNIFTTFFWIVKLFPYSHISSHNESKLKPIIKHAHMNVNIDSVWRCI